MKKKYIEQVLSLLQIQAKISNQSFRNSQVHSKDCDLPLYVNVMAITTLLRFFTGPTNTKDHTRTMSAELCRDFNNRNSFFDHKVFSTIFAA